MKNGLKFCICPSCCVWISSERCQKLFCCRGWSAIIKLSVCLAKTEPLDLKIKRFLSTTQRSKSYPPRDMVLIKSTRYLYCRTEDWVIIYALHGLISHFTTLSFSQLKQVKRRCPLLISICEITPWEWFFCKSFPNVLQDSHSNSLQVKLEILFLLD